MFTLFISYFILQSSFYLLTHATAGITDNELPSNYQLFLEARNWVDAELFCQERGGHLISIHDETTNLQIANYLLTALPSPASYSWIGFNQADETWTDNSPHDYTPGLGQNPQGECTTIDANNNPLYRGYWMGPPCDNAYPFMCNIPSKQSECNHLEGFLTNQCRSYSGAENSYKFVCVDDNTIEHRSYSGLNCNESQLEYKYPSNCTSQNNCYCAAANDAECDSIDVNVTECDGHQQQVHTIFVDKCLSDGTNGSYSYHCKDNGKFVIQSYDNINCELSQSYTEKIFPTSCHVDIDVAVTCGLNASEVKYFVDRITSDCTGNEIERETVIIDECQFEPFSNSPSRPYKYFCDENDQLGLEYYIRGTGDCNGNVQLETILDSNDECIDGEIVSSTCGCNTDEFQCDNKKCIPKEWICDQIQDCPDNSDEVNCTTTTLQPGSTSTSEPVECTENEFKCEIDNKCIPNYWICDQIQDCKDNSDETNCTDTTTSRPFTTSRPTTTSGPTTTSTVISGWSSWYGGNGGLLYEAEGTDNATYVTKICIREGDYIDAIEIEFNDGTNSGLLGGTGGVFGGCFSVNENECFTSVTLQHGWYVDSLQFVTSTGQKSPMFGGNAVLPNFSIKGNGCITKIDVRTGSVLDAIRFFFDDAVTPKETTIPTTTTSEPNICFWGRDGSNAHLMNGEWTYEGIFNGGPYYSLSIDASFGFSIQYLWRSGTQYYITDYPPGTLNSFRSSCTVSSNDPISCGQGNWRVGSEGSNDPNVFVQGAPCPLWDCDEITTTQTYGGCDGPFNQKVGQNEYYNGDNLYWYFNPNYFSWICSNTITYGSGASYYAISGGWTDVVKGESISMNFQYPTTASFQVQCIKHNSTTIPTTTPQPTSTLVTRLCTEELQDFNVGAMFVGNGGCQQDTSGSLLSQDISGSASFSDCLSLCEEYGCKSFLFGKKGLSKENWCNLYSVECADDGDKDWYMFTPINNAEIMCNSIN